MFVSQEPKHHHINPFSQSKTKRPSIIKQRKFSVRSMDRKESTESMTLNNEDATYVAATNKGKPSTKAAKNS